MYLLIVPPSQEADRLLYYMVVMRSVLDYNIALALGYLQFD
jgi:hypothetical protein